MATLNSKIPTGPLAEKWRKHKTEIKLVNPANKRKYEVIVVGAGLAGASAASSLADLGYKVKCFVFHDSPRRAHSIAAQGGINAAKNYQNDGDSVHRLFYDTLKGGDYRAREANVHRLAEVSVNIIDQCVAQGVPFAREYGGLLANRSFGGAQVSRTFYARGQTGQQLLLGAYSALSRTVGTGAVDLHTNSEMLDLVVVNGQAKGVIIRNLVTGAISRHSADAVILATGGYGNVFNLSTYARGSNTTAWAPKKSGDTRTAADIPESDRDYFLERLYPSFGNLAPRDIASRAAKRVCDEGRGVGTTGLGVYLDFADAIGRLGEPAVRERYGNLFDIYHEITAENAYKAPMRIYPAVHYTMGGLWVDYNLMSNIPGLFVLGEANFSDHGANRLGASALMQGLADGYFVIPYTVGDYLAGQKPGSRPSTDGAEFKQAEDSVRGLSNRLLATKGKQPVSYFHKKLGKIIWDHCGMSRTKAGLESALQKIPALREEFNATVNVPGSAETLNQSLEKAGRVADFIELGELMCRDALTREESCGGHFREEHQEADGECKRDDQNFAHVAAWEYQGDSKAPLRNTEPLNYEFTKMSVRNYK